MSKVWNGNSYDEDWFPVDGEGNRIGDKDWRANAEWAAATGGQNPYTNASGASPWDQSGQTPGNEAGSTLPKVTGNTAFDTEAYKDLLAGWFPGKRVIPKGYPVPSMGGNLNYTMGVPTSYGYTPPSAAPSGLSRGSVSGASSGFSGDGRSQIAQAYQQYLGRGASQDEINNWWSGAYGYGAGDAGLSAILNAIANSDEAKQRGGSGMVLGQGGDTNHGYDQPTSSQPYQNFDWWSAQGVPTSQIFNTQTGQLNPGWTRTANGYERTGGATQSGPPGGDYRSWIMSLLGGKAPTPESLQAIEGQLNQYGVKLQKDSAGRIRGRIYLPNGMAVDLINQWGQPWTWIERGIGSGDGPSGGGLNLPPNQYSDANTALLETLLKNRIGALSSPVDDANRAMYEAALNERARSLAAGNKQIDQLMGYLQKRFTDLQGPGYTGAENEVIRTGALDPIEQDRKAARDRVMERLSARGIDPKSGIAQQALLDVDKAFDALRGSTQTQLAGNELARREDRAQRAQAIGAQLADIPDQRAREQLDVYSTLANLSQLARNENDARAREAVSYGGALSDLGPQRLQLAMQAAGMGGNPSSLGSLLTQIAGLNQNASAYNAQNSNSLWSGLGTIAAIMARQGQYGLGR